MGYKRIYVRVPISGEAILSFSKETNIKAQTIDISLGGLAIIGPREPLTKNNYNVIISTKNGKKIELTAGLVRQEEEIFGFKTSHLDENNLRIITDLVFEYQETIDFIKQIEKYNLFDHWLTDDEGNALDITFNEDPDHP
jgi:c-di-GMP-binding flagellar brake protein YcgR